MVKTWNITIPDLSGDQQRRAYLYLPDTYRKEPDRRYPVMYMFDGHNVFFDSDATFGKSWGMNGYMNRSRKRLIIAAVECNHEGNRRLQEYAPFSFENADLGRIRGQGTAYMNWLIKVFKPYIDSNYRTLPDREHTVICGSSMGGLMALYAVCACNRVFRRAACLSPSLWVDPGKVLQMIAGARIRPDTCVYMDYGSHEIGHHAATTEILVAASHLLLTKQVDLTMRIVPGGDHSEASWERQIPIFMDCLGL